jgi:hypothetical protein
VPGAIVVLPVAGLVVLVLALAGADDPGLVEVAAPPLTQYTLLDVVLLSVGLPKGEQPVGAPGEVVILVPGVLVVVAPDIANAAGKRESKNKLNRIYFM